MNATSLLLRRDPLPAGAPPIDTRAHAAGGEGRSRLARLMRGGADEPVWARPGLLAVLVLSAFLVFWHLTRNGYSNDYYAAAAKSGSVSWKAWFFGSLDPGSFITVDKPPLSLWLMGLSARVLGFSSFAILLPQALCTVAAVGLTYSTAKRAFGPAAGLAGALALALTPITVAIGRVNNPDALLILLLVGSAALTLRAVESGRTKHLVWAGVLVGLAFMTKMLQGWMILPALAGTYAVAGPVPVLQRLKQLALFGVATLAASAAWPVAVTLWPGSTPYIGGSTNGSIWNLILGYNGLGRITGNESGSGAGGGGPTFGGAAGLWRMFNAEVGGQVAWLLPFAALSLIAGLVVTRRAARTDVARAGWLLFGLWALVHVVVFSTAKGIFHPYYTSALAPAVAVLAGAGFVSLAGAARRSWLAWAVLAAGLSGSAVLAVSLLRRAPDYAAWLQVGVPVAAAITVLALLTVKLGGPRRLVAVAAVAGAFALLAAPGSWAVANVGHTLNGNNVLAGPDSAARGGMGGRGGFGGGVGRGAGRGGFPGGGTPPSGGAQGGAPPALPSGASAAGAAPGGTAAGGTGTAAGGTAAGGTAAGGTAAGGTGTAAGGTAAGGTAAGGTAAGGAAGATGAAPGGGQAGGGLGGGSVSDTVIAYLQAHQGSAKYLLAASGSQTTAGIIVKTGEPVVTIGGFGGSDPAPTVAQLAAMVKQGELKYVLVGGQGGGGRGGNAALTAWVTAHGKAITDVTVSSGTLYLVSA